MRSTIARLTIPAALITVITGLLCASLAERVSAAPTSFEIKSGTPSLVVFDSKSTMESFQGKTHNVTGTIRADTGNLADSVDVNVTVDLASLDTGISLRNKHMREDHLETDKYPNAVFHGRKLLDPSAPSLTPGQTVTFRIAGDFTLHGVTRAIEVPVTVSMGADGASINIKGGFPVTLADYKISRPKFLVMRLGETQKVSLDLSAVRQAGQ
jgi:polyisoprenoid-binding protein YceI